MLPKRKPSLLLALLHSVLLTLCIPASFLIFSHKPLFTRALALFLMLAYLYFFVVNHIADLIIDGLSFFTFKYSSTHSLREIPTNRVPPVTSSDPNELFQGRSQSLSGSNQGGEQSEADRSKRSSYRLGSSRLNSSFRLNSSQLNSSQLNGSRLSTSNSQDRMVRSISRSKFHAQARSKQERPEGSSQGWDIMCLLTLDNSLNRSFSSEDGNSLRFRDSLLANNDSLQKEEQKELSDCSSNWESTLTYYQIGKNQLDATYSKLRSHLANLIRPILKDLQALREEFILLTEASFYVKVHDGRKYKPPIGNRHPPRLENYENVEFILTRLSQSRSALSQLQYTFREGINTDTFFAALARLSSRMQELDRRLGCPNLHSKWSNEEVRGHLKMRWEYGSTMKSFLEEYEAGSVDRNTGRQSSSEYYKGRVYLLYVMVMHVNGLGPGRSLKLSDRLHFHPGKPVSAKWEYEVYLLVGYDNVMPHYNLRRLRDGDIQHCQPGPLNYLSVMMLYLLQQTAAPHPRNDPLANFANLILAHLRGF